MYAMTRNLALKILGLSVRIAGNKHVSDDLRVTKWDGADGIDGVEHSDSCSGDMHGVNDKARRRDILVMSGCATSRLQMWKEVIVMILEEGQTLKRMVKEIIGTEQVDTLEKSDDESDQVLSNDHLMICLPVKSWTKVSE